MAKIEHIRRERDREIYRLYKESRELLPSATERQLYNVVSVLPASSFYMGAETCAKFLSRMLRGDDLSELPYGSRVRYYALLRLYGEMSAKGMTKGRSMASVTEDLVTMPAPSFFMSPRGIRKVVCMMRVEERRRLYERYK